MVPHLAALGSQVLPPLTVLERELKLDLPMADIEKCLLDLAQKGQDAGQD